MGYLVKGHCGRMTIGLACVVGGCVTDVILPLFTGKVINLIVAGDYEAVKKYCLWVFVICCGSGLLGGFRGYLFNSASVHLSKDIQ